MPLGFDLTQFATPTRVAPPVKREEPQPQAQAPRPVKPNQPTTLEEALHKPVTAGQLVDEEGRPFEDKLARKAPTLKHELWSVDKFVEPDGLPVDQNGNPMIKAPAATGEDRKEINHE